MTSVVTVRARAISGAGALIVGAVFLTASSFLAFHLNVWQDEAYSLHSTAGSLFDAFRQAVGFEAQAPLYFVLLAAWRAAFPSAFGARLLSIGFSITTLYVTWLFAKRYLAPVPASLVVAAVAFNPFTIWAAVEIRPYAAAITFASIAIYAFFRGFVDEADDTRAQLVFLAALIFGTYTQYYVAAVLPAAGVALLAMGRFEALRSFGTTVLAFVAAIFPLVSIVPAQTSAYTTFGQAFSASPFAMVSVPLEYALSHDWVGSWRHGAALNAVYVTAFALPVVAGAGAFGPARRCTVGLAAIVATMFAEFTFATTVLHVHVLAPRHTLVMLTAVIWLVAASIGDVASRRRAFVLGVYAIGFVTFATLSFGHDYRTLAKPGDWARVADYVEAKASPADTVAIFNSEAELPFRYYFRGPNAVRAIPHPMTFERFDQSDFILRSDAEAARAIGNDGTRSGKIWLVESPVCGLEPDFFDCRRLDRFVAGRFTVLSVVRFSGSSVFELSPKSLATRSAS